MDLIPWTLRMNYKTLVPFKPICIFQSEIKIDDDWAEKLRSWCKYAGAVDRNGVITTFDSPYGDPHEQSWVKDILTNISPIDQFYNSWVQVYSDGSAHQCHNHVSDDVNVSGCLYFESGKSTVFQDPLYPSRHVSIPVGKGSVLLWDPALYHSSPPISKERMVLAFNLYHHKYYATYEYRSNL